MKLKVSVIKGIMAQIGMSQVELGSKIITNIGPMNQGSVSKMFFRGATSQKIVEQIAAALNVPVERIVEFGSQVVQAPVNNTKELDRWKEITDQLIIDLKKVRDENERLRLELDKVNGVIPK